MCVGVLEGRILQDEHKEEESNFSSVQESKFPLLCAIQSACGGAGVIVGFEPQRPFPALMIPDSLLLWDMGK